MNAPRALVHSKYLGQMYAIWNTSRVSNPHTRVSSSGLEVIVLIVEFLTLTPCGEKM